jgi:transcriptional regulator with XRE-family HTH domain
MEQVGSSCSTPPKASVAIRAWRKSAGLTRAQLAAEVGCSLAFLANLEQGYIPKTSPTLSRVLDALEAATEAADAERADV